MKTECMNLVLLVKREFDDSAMKPKVLSDLEASEMATYLGASVAQRAGVDHVFSIAIGKTLFNGFHSKLTESGIERVNQSTKMDENVLILDDNDIDNTLEVGVEGMSDNAGYRYDLLSLSVFVQISDNDVIHNGDNIIPLHPKTREIINKTFDGLECVYLGMGVNDRMKDLFICDYDVLFEIKSLIQESEEHVWKSYEFAFIKGPKDMTYVPYVTLSDFQRLWKNETDDVISHQSIYVRNLRAGIEVMDLLGRNFKVIKLPVEALEEIPSEDDIKHFEKMKEEKGIVKEILLGKPSTKATADSISISNYDSGDIGMVASIVNFFDGKTPTTRVAHYPINHGDEKLLDDLKSQLEEKHPGKQIELKYIDVSEWRNHNRLLANLAR